MKLVEIDQLGLEHDFNVAKLAIMALRMDREKEVSRLKRQLIIARCRDLNFVRGLQRMCAEFLIVDDQQDTRSGG